MMGSIMWGYSGGIFMLLFWILIIVALVALIRWLIGGQRTGSGSAPGPSESALDILKKRYARGEISKEQFESMKRHIE
jgi:putative membrane protein